MEIETRYSTNLESIDGFYRTRYEALDEDGFPLFELSLYAVNRIPEARLAELSRRMIALIETHSQTIED